jgi:hypothetical protein
LLLPLGPPEEKTTIQIKSTTTIATVVVSVELETDETRRAEVNLKGDLKNLKKYVLHGCEGGGDARVKREMSEQGRT